MEMKSKVKSNTKGVVSWNNKKIHTKINSAL